MNSRCYRLLSLSLLLLAVKTSSATPTTFTVKETDHRIRLGIKGQPRQLFDDDDELTLFEEGSGFGDDITPPDQLAEDIQGSLSDLYNLTGDLSNVLDEEVNGYNGDVFAAIDDFQNHMENATQVMAANLQCQFSRRFQESLSIMEKIYSLTPEEMEQIQIQIRETTTTNYTVTEEDSTDSPVIVEVENLPKDCEEAYRSNAVTGRTTIRPDRNADPKDVWCDQNTDGGGWTTIMRREPQPIQLDFRNGWESYKVGFGSPEGEHWIGLETIHQLTKRRPYQLRVDMAAEGDNAFALYKTFRVGPEWRKFKLRVSGFVESSTAGDAIEYHNGQKFTTFDDDNDGASGGNCANWSGGGGWWYDFCYLTNPTAIYPTTNMTGQQSDEFLEWRRWQGPYNYLTHFAMMIKPQDEDTLA